MDPRWRRPWETKSFTGKLLSSKPVSVSRAAKIMSRFATMDAGASPSVSKQVDRTANALNRLVQFHKKMAHKKRKRNRDGDYIDSESSAANKITAVDLENKRKSPEPVGDDDIQSQPPPQENEKTATS